MGKSGRPQVVYIVEDDEDERGVLSGQGRSAGLEGRPYESAERFLNEVVDGERVCILLDITMPLLTGIQVQERLNQRQIALPVITISARDDDETRKLARELGARLFLRKPVDDQALLDAIQWVTAGA